MRWFHRAALVLIGTIVTMTIVVALLVNLDPQRYKSYVEERITEALGRNFSINGRIDFSVGSDIRLLLEDIRIAGTDWDDVDDLVSVAQLEITLRTWSLISGPLSIEQLRLAGVQVNLQSAEDGRRNWVLFPDVEPASAEQPSQPASLPVIVRQAEIRNFNVNYVDSSLQQPLRVEIEIANEQIIESRQLQLDLTGTINETPAGLTFSASSTHDLVDLADFVVSLQGNLGQVELAGTGTIDDFLAPRQPGGSLEIRGPNVQYLSDLLGMNSVMTGPLELSATLAPGTGDEVVFALDGVFGEFVIEANGSFVDLQSLDQFKVDAQASGPDARAIGNLFGYDSLPKDPFSIVAAARVAGSNIAIEDIALKIGESQFNVTGQFNDFPRPDGASLSLHAGGPDFGEFNRLLGLPGKLTGPFALDATIAAKPSQRAALSLTARNKDIAFAIDGNLVDDPQLIGSTVKLHCNGDNFAIVAAALGLTPTPQVGFDMRVSVERTGRGFKLTGGVVVLGNDRLEIDGLVGNVPLQHETDIKFSANAPDIGATLKGFGVNADGLPSGDFNASGRVFRDDGVFVLDNIAASIGLENEYILTGEGRVSDPPDFVHSNGRIALRAMNLRPFAALAGIAEIPDSPFVGSVDAERLATGISFKQAQFQLGADTLTFSGFVGERPFESNTDVQFQLQSDNLRLLLHDFGLAADSIPAEAFTGAGKLKVRDGIIEIRDTSLTLAGGELTAVGKLGTPSNFNGTNIDLILHGENLARLLPGIVAYDLASEPYSIRSNIRLVQSVLTIKGLDASVGQASLSGSASVKLDPLLEEGHFSVSAKAPRFDQLVPRYSEYVLTSQVPVTLESKGRWNKSTFHFDKYRLTIGKGHMIVDGMLDRPPGFDNLNLRLDIHIDNVNNLSPLTGRPLPEESADLKARLIGRQDRVLLTDLYARLGQSDLQGELSFQEGAVPEVSVRLVSNRLNLDRYLPASENESKTRSPDAASTLLSQTPFDLEPLRKFNAEFDLRVTAIDVRQQALRNVALIGTLNAGKMRISDFQLAGEEGGSFSGDLTLQAVDTQAQLAMTLKGRQLNLGLPAETTEELHRLPKYDVESAISAAGRSVAELAGSLNGYVRIVSGPGRVRANAMRLFTQDFLSELLQTINPFTKEDPNTDVTCATILLKADNGKLVGQPALIVQTDMLNIFATGELDLKTEKLSVQLNTVAQKGIGISLSNLITPYVRVVGTLANPTLELDAENALLEGGVAVATAGISFLAQRLSDRYLSAKNACGKAVADTAEEFDQLEKKYSVH